MDSITGIQFVEAEAHPGEGQVQPVFYYVKFLNSEDKTLLRAFFPSPNLDENDELTELHPERIEIYERFRDRFLGREGVKIA